MTNNNNMIFFYQNINKRIHATPLNIILVWVKKTNFVAVAWFKAVRSEYYSNNWHGDKRILFAITF